VFNNIEAIECAECNMRVTSNDIIEEANPGVIANDCKTLEETSEDFRNGIKTIIEKSKEVNKYRAVIKKKIGSIYSEYNKYILPQLNILKGYRKQTLSKIVALEDYKITNNKVSALNRFITKFTTKFNIHSYELRRYLEPIYGTTITRWYNQLSYTVQKKFRIRI
jgi:hypothetical protein